ncbi:methylated-DNA-[protein]-cysteine S-methyltransferase [Dethiosulfatibacter aminovorans DSM 17477]|uniref:methylated-DNA--[protein]-cysteine S-methyltransferase n=1 Tax=Dethiosulfatibacter aminovorans DSM 17477 TaxID=1121476 RepID=A0A1M6ATA7_9FIRM|nr:methylated-DNA--[protein]-cysteine S-methyltransferase [Dethiosulfatibacter aminovorans]SHI39754.1 methylated-DNA-[protein]-cysteine S-methyltransferase [Dethiosulfatibacter aminovorans DSM 17477]
MIYFKRHTKWGDITVCIDAEANIAGLWFDGQKYFPDIPEDACWIEDIPENSSSDFPAVQARVDRQMETIKQFDIQMMEYEEGKRKSFDLPLCPEGSEFRQAVWNELLKIPMGQTSTYGEISARVAARQGKESMSPQAVGGAVGHNPISLLIPCHRVIGADGSLTGYAGGLDKKAALLKHESLKI